MGFQIGWIDQHCPLPLYLFHSAVHEIVHCIVEAEVFSSHANASTTQSIRIKKAAIVTRNLSFALGGGGVQKNGTRVGLEQDCSNANAPRQLPNSIPAIGDTNKAIACDHSLT